MKRTFISLELSISNILFPGIEH